ncbi:ATP-dependent RNA helicase [Paraphotobacterium marinum]|uniref:DEAD-box ATP-dependent RNA helicase RhpA n=1 Tax=Paraphotobacterium marinum TaxID=1755811 RepID=A0A220VHK0_9GAMM|nr:DEAD/DEAH box helicase [Paraphotobacterium marinum]ASK79781.1 ATP-dependent RNA helicase [Paraphotobacterium marinum]
MSNSIERFDQLNLKSSILSSLEDINFINPTPIQAASIPPLLDGNDVLGKAQTGTGKTAAFSLPILNKINFSQKKPQAIIMAPTRELAIQVAAEIKTLGQNIEKLFVTEIYGGASIVDQMKVLKKNPQIVVGTPGRVKDLISRNKLHLDEVETFVLDEADEMLKMGFVDDVTWIMEQAPNSAQRVLFSATMPPVVKDIVNKFLRKPVKIDVAGENKTVSKVDQKFWVVKGVDKDEALSRLLETENPDASIIFVRTKQDTEKLSDHLTRKGFKVSALHGDIPQSLRERTVEHIKKGVIDILVATDVVARGLDVPRISHVFNYDIPFDVESYIHRIGRTGRAGRSGKAILFVRTNQLKMLRTIERVTKSKMSEISLPLRDDVAKARLNKLATDIEQEKEFKYLDKFIALKDQLKEKIQISDDELCAILLRKVQGTRPLFYQGPDPMIAALERDQKRNERRKKGEKTKSGDGFKGDWDTYQLQVGREHGVQVKDIVGALANELDLSKDLIGGIKLTPRHTLVQLPKNLQDATVTHLKKLKIRQNKVNAVVVYDDTMNENRKSRRNSGHRGRSRNEQGSRPERKFDRNRASKNRVKNK